MSVPYSTPSPSVGVEITNRCNLACRHCFNHSGEGALQELALDELLCLFDQVRDMGGTRIRISGGEPTLHPNFAAIVAGASQRGLLVALNSHGMYSAHLRAQMADLPIETFIISLDGLRDANDMIRGRGVFDRAVDTVAWLRGMQRSVVLGVHVGRYNANDVEGLIALAAQWGADIKFAPVRPVGRAREGLRNSVLLPIEFYQLVQTVTRLRGRYLHIQISTDLDILRPIDPATPRLPAQASCPAGRSMLNVNYDGYVYPCAFLVTPQREFAAGRLSDTPLLTLWQESPVFAPFRTLNKDARCQTCFAYGRTCVGGCVALSYFAAGRLDALDPTCFMEYVPPTGQEERV